jgi:hypothetical protein
MEYDEGGAGEGAGGGFGSPGEQTTFTVRPTGVPRFPTTPRPVEAPQSVPYSSGGSGINAGGSIQGTFTQRLIGYDPFGNPIYEYVREPVYRESYDLNPGWNSRAYCPEAIWPSMYLSFRAGAVVGAVVGLTANPAATAGYEDIILGWMVLDGTAYIVARGLVIHSVPVATTLPDAGKYNRDVDALTIIKKRNKVEFYLTSITGQGGNGFTKIAEATMSEPVTYVSAALYLGGDTISNEVLEYPDFVEADLPALRGGIFEAADYAYVLGQFPSLTGQIFEQDFTVVSGSFPALTGLIGDEDVTLMLGDLPALTGEIESYSDTGAVPEFNYTFGVFPALAGAMMVYDEEFATVAASLPALGGLISEAADPTIVRGILPALRGAIQEEEFADRLTLVSFGYIAGRAIIRPTVLVVMNSSAEVVGVLTLEEIQSMLLESDVEAVSNATLTEIIYQLLSSTMSAADVASLQRDGMSVWALHMDAMGSTQYQNYDFNSFMTLDGKTYGVNTTGIHLLGGDTDDASAITASVDFGSLSFDTNNRKAVPYVYVGMSSSGKTVLKVESDGRTYYYTARDSTELMKTHRFELGRGLRSNFYGFTLVATGKTFDLHNIEFFPLELKRRL